MPRAIVGGRYWRGPRADCASTATRHLHDNDPWSSHGTTGPEPAAEEGAKLTVGTPAGSRKPLSYITNRYDRVARFYRALEPLFLIFPRARRKAVRALDLAPGDTVLEIGAGSGRNLPYLVDAVGRGGKIVAIDASPGMLREARALVRRHGWSNVELLQQDAARLQVDSPVDGVLFSLSYSVLPDPIPAVERAWALMAPSARLVVMDAGLSYTPLRRALAPVARLLVKLGPGDPNSRPVEDLAAYGPVQVEHFMLGIYYVCTVQKSPAAR